MVKTFSRQERSIQKWNWCPKTGGRHKNEAPKERVVRVSAHKPRGQSKLLFCYVTRTIHLNK